MIAQRTARIARRHSAFSRAKNRKFRVFFAWCVVLLQLVTALHFALVPHAFTAGLSGFVHVHARAERARAERAHELAASSHSLIKDTGACLGESCPFGFAGPSALEVACLEAGALLPEIAPSARASLSSFVPARARVLLSAPKTSPPV